MKTRPVDGPRKRRSWRSLLVAFILLPVVVPLLLYGGIHLMHPNAGPQNIRVSKETTFVTGPLDNEGFVDYVAAINRYASQGVTPENNAAVLLIQALGPPELSPALLEEFYAGLQIEPPPAEGDYFLSAEAFIERYPEFMPPDPEMDDNGPLESDLSQTQREAQHARFEQDLDTLIAQGDWDAFHRALSEGPREGYDPRIDVFERQETVASMYPWRKEHYPAVAAWLKANEQPFELIVQATRRPKFFIPIVSDASSMKLMKALHFSLQDLRSVGRALLTRAMLRLGEGDADGAWHDLFTLHRLSRLMSQHPTLIGALLSDATEGIAMEGDILLMHYGELTPELVVRIRADLESLPPRGDMIEKFDIGERMQILDTLISLGRDGFLEDSDGTSKNSLMQHWHNTVVNWNNILGYANSYLDRIVAANRLPLDEQEDAVAELEQELNGVITEGRRPLTIVTGALVGSQREKVITARLFPLLLAAHRTVINARMRTLEQFELAKLGFAVAAYRTRHGEHPSSLDPLVPYFLSKTPLDPTWQQPYLYRRTQHGFTLYSVGPNGKDDGGVLQVDVERGQGYDYVLQVPQPAKVSRLGFFID